MSNKISGKKEQTVSTGLEVTSQLIEYALAVVVIAVCIAVPLYAKNGYHQIGDAKFAAYKVIMTFGFAVLLVMAVIWLFFRLREKNRLRVSVTDVLAAAYLVLAGVSVISGGFYEDALWGCDGWNMGLMSQISFVLLYLFLSRFGRYYRLTTAVLCAVSAVVFSLGVLHRMMIDPIGFYEGLEDYQKAQFLSTLGQATWYASFLAVVLPVGIAVFLEAKSMVVRILSGVYVFVGFCSLVTQNSDSAYFALAGFMLVFFWVSVENGERCKRFLWICTLFFGAGKVMYFLMKLRPNPALEYDIITEIILCSPVTWLLLAVCLLGCAALHFREGLRGAKGSPYPVKSMLRVRKGVVIAAGVLCVGIISLIVLRTKNLLPEAVAQGLAEVSYFQWNDDWGNGRGRIWSFALKVYREENLLHKLFGVGPDCFNSYVTQYYSEEAALLWGEMLLTNAHNEWLNILINTGLLGAAAYIGFFMTAVYRFLKAAPRNLLVTGAAAAAVSYMAYNFFCYQQVLCTPFIFILLGTGEYILRRPNNG
ncbi:MAG: O-antigen ligase family protein [Clostridiales bacterium]|nr:O-antigen ligase family protein [Clostridiales bacterium]